MKSNLKVNSKYGSWFQRALHQKELKNDKFKNDSIISIWFAEDEKRYPIKFWIKMKYGGLVIGTYMNLNNQKNRFISLNITVSIKKSKNDIPIC